MVRQVRPGIGIGNSGIENTGIRNTEYTANILLSIARSKDSSYNPTLDFAKRATTGEMRLPMYKNSLVSVTLVFCG